jgi:hypothetical protein
MSRIPMSIMALLLVLLGSSAINGQSSAMQSISESHIEANVPEEKDFDSFLKRDLTAYFKEPGKNLSVEYELLRKGPTQAGVALPKFYAWVMIKENGILREEGAARIAAIEKKKFEVVQYFSKADIARDMELMYRVFPKSVAGKIKEKVGK